ncbi:tetratricopeptide repeat protein [Streptomyces kunmingensis]|uniref:Tetratricopeptide repeat protein n=1 Tax=Streptomyces kunmingensis TaxID=68225 RepID=A0ABU6CNT0_9ACTN|nr:helix-turn-helix domain-containing protein [Streptomyces kunmingensis]MEB3966373.1 tetratricopeptide repeat protein [Streptomyces kunmingensis]
MDNEQAQGARDALRHMLTDARAKERWTLVRLAGRTGLSRTTVSKALNGRETSPDTLVRLAGALKLDPNVLLGLHRAATSGTRIDKSSEPLPAPDPEEKERLGRSIGGLNPYALEVHRSIGTSASAVQSPHLPHYVKRAHDHALRAVARKAVEGISQMVVLVGSSSTGKTRACWEVLQSLPSDWLLWHPIDPDRPDAALRDVARVGPRTVVWLNEAQHYLLDPRVGEQVAAGLRSLLGDESRGPVLVLGTIWPEYHEPLVREPRVHLRETDLHPQARALLAGRCVAVPGRFEDAAVESMKRGADQVLAFAAARAEDGMVAQYLAGAPELRGRFVQASPGVRALLEAAMDARRVGHPLALPLPFLASAAEGYLTDSEWDLLAENWLEHALALVSEPVRGARGALSPVRRPRGGIASSSVPAYRLADFLEQLGHTRRTPAPGLFWQAAVQHLRGTVAADFSRQAASRHLLEVAHRLAVVSEDAGALLDAADRLFDAGLIEEALHWFQQSADQGAVFAYGIAAQRLVRAGLEETAQEWWAKSRATKPSSFRRHSSLEEDALQGDFMAGRKIGRRLAHRGRIDDALPWLTRDNDPMNLHIAGYFLAAYPDRVDEAVEWWKRSSAAGHSYALQHASTLLAEHGRWSEAWDLAAQSAGRDGPHAFRSIAAVLFGEDDLDDAAKWYEQGGLAGDSVAFRVMADRLVKAGRLADSVDWYKKAQQHGDMTLPGLSTWPDALSLDETIMAALPRHVAMYLSEKAISDLRLQGRDREADELSKTAAEVLGPTAILMDDAIHRYVQAGQNREAAETAQRAYQWTAEPLYLMTAAAALLRHGQLDEAVQIYWQASGAGRSEALSEAGEHLAAAGRLDEALSLFRKAAEGGDLNAHYRAAKHLSRADRLDEAVEWLQGVPAEILSDALVNTANLLANAGRIDEAVRALEHAARLASSQSNLDPGWLATHTAITLLRTAGRDRQASLLERFGWAADGGISSEWHP